MANKNTKQDPWMLDANDAQEMKNMTKSSGTGGVFCPKRNVSMSGSCKACEGLQPLWDYPDGSKQRLIASRKSAKVSYFMNVVFDSDRDKSIVLEVGKRAGDYIINSIYDPDKNWKMVAHPMEGKGFEVKIKKLKGDRDYNTYDVFRGDTCDWSISKDVLENLTDISQENIINMLQNGELVEGENYMKASSLKLDETLKFRICPPYNYKDGGKLILTPVFRHWGGVTQAEVDGDTLLNLSVEVDDGSQPDTSSVKEPSFLSEDRPDRTVEKASNDYPSCFGVIEPMVFFDEGDEDCKECKVFTLCSKEIARNQKRKAKEQLG